MIDIEKSFEKYSDEYLEFERVENKLSLRPDLCAFLLLDKLLPEPGKSIIGAVEHDEVYFNVDGDKLEEVASDDDILTLVRCGVRYDEYYGLSMFV